MTQISQFRPFLAGLLGLAAFVLAAQGAARAETPELGPSIGSALPHDLAATDGAGVEQSFDALTGENGLAVFFVRSVDWCPYCQAQVLDVADRQSEFANRGVNVVIISHDTTEEAATFTQKNELAVPVIGDPSFEIINAFGVRNESYDESEFARGAPHPIMLFADADRIIRAKLYQEDYLANARSYRERPELDDFLTRIDEVFAADE